ncbi:MAG: TauD/TfdA family dioxygenase [Myxococcota bacterium]
MLNSDTGPADLRVRTRPLRPGADLPLVLEPAGDRSAAALADGLGRNRSQVQQLLREHGALLLRGFGIDTPEQFEQVALAIDPELEDEYLGTSPRNALTKHVFTASELPEFYPIPQHCEMSFLKTPPRRLFFHCLVASRTGGETPLVDFRKVLADMDPAVRRRFEENGIRNIRNYAAPGSRRNLDPFQLKAWPEMFGTTDRARVEAKCEEQGFEASWGADGSLRLTNRQPATRNHPETGQPAWFNHSQVFHLATGPAELQRIWKHRRDLRSLLLWQATRVAVALKRRLQAPEEQAMHCTYADGREIPAADMDHVRDLIWKHMVAFPWQQGDVVAIDNFAVSHGRLPYRGPRTIAVAWA